MTIRPFRASDRAALREVCMRTAHAGQDATGLFTDDALWPDVFLDPYLDFDPGLCFVVDARGRAAGYVVATADTRAFVERYRREWMPGLAAKYPHVDPPVGLEQLIAHLGFTPERMLHPAVDAYPAHLHIDLLPELQGRGRGRALIRRLLAELRARGVPGVHLGIDPANAAAAQFYRRLGFVELPSSTADEPRFGIATDAGV